MIKFIAGVVVGFIIAAALAAALPIIITIGLWSCGIIATAITVTGLVALGRWTARKEVRQHE